MISGPERTRVGTASDIRAKGGALIARRIGVLLVAAVGCLLVLLAGDRIIRGVAAIHSPVEAMYGESIIYDQAARLVRGEALYQPLDRSPFTVAAYTPLHYVLVAALQPLALPPFMPGRVLSFASALVVAVLVGWLAARRTIDRRAGLFAALLFVAFGFPGDFPWFAFYKEDMFGVALSMVALAVLDHGSDRRHAAWAGALAGLAFLTKQTFVAVGLAGVAWLWFRNRPSAGAFAIVAFTVGLLPCLLLALSNPAFTENTILANLNPSRGEILRSNLVVLWRSQGVLVVLALLPVVLGVLPARQWLQDPLVPFWLLTLLLLPVGLAKVGSNTNYWIDFAAATTVLCTRGIWLLALRSGAPLLGRVAASVALVALLASPAWQPAPSISLQTAVDRIAHPDERQAAEFARVLERVRAEPRGVYSEPLDIVVLAGRKLLMEPFIFSILNGEGRWDAANAVHQICSGEIGLVVLDHRLEGPDWMTHNYLHWPVPVLDALRSSMRLEREQAGLFLYVPKDQPLGAESEAPCRAAETEGSPVAVRF
jgi:hypothetical protein